MTIITGSPVRMKPRLRPKSIPYRTRASTSFKLSVEPVIVKGIENKRKDRISKKKFTYLQSEVDKFPAKDDTGGPLARLL